MAGVLIYKSGIMQSHYSFVIGNNSEYADMRNSLLKIESNSILWERNKVSLEQIENARKTKDDLVRKLNEGEEVDLYKELDVFFY
jgi:uncharacterized Zn ribbon protein